MSTVTVTHELLDQVVTRRLRSAAHRAADAGAQSVADDLLDLLETYRKSRAAESEPDVLAGILERATEALDEAGVGHAHLSLPTRLRAYTGERRAAAQAAPHGGTDAGVSIAAFQRANVERCNAVFRRLDASPRSFYAMALAGEVGELCNVLKKLEDGIFPVPDGALESEFGDVLPYLALLAERCGVDLEAVTLRKFDEVSDRRGYAVKLATPTTPEGPRYVTAAEIERDHDNARALADAARDYSEAFEDADGEEEEAPVRAAFSALLDAARRWMAPAVAAPKGPDLRAVAPPTVEGAREQGFVDGIVECRARLARMLGYRRAENDAASPHPDAVLARTYERVEQRAIDDALRMLKTADAGARERDPRWVAGYLQGVDDATSKRALVVDATRPMLCAHPKGEGGLCGEPVVPPGDACRDHEPTNPAAFPLPKSGSSEHPIGPDAQWSAAPGGDAMDIERLRETTDEVSARAREWLEDVLQQALCIMSDDSSTDEYAAAMRMAKAVRGAVDDCPWPTPTAPKDPAAPLQGGRDGEVEMHWSDWTGDRVGFFDALSTAIAYARDHGIARPLIGRRGGPCVRLLVDPEPGLEDAPAHLQGGIDVLDAARAEGEPDHVLRLCAAVVRGAWELPDDDGELCTTLAVRARQQWDACRAALRAAGLPPPGVGVKARAAAATQGGDAGAPETWEDDAALVRRAVANLGGAGARSRSRWSYVARTFALGSGYSAKLCRRLGLDPDEVIGEPDEAASPLPEGGTSCPDCKGTGVLHFAGETDPTNGVTERLQEPCHCPEGVEAALTEQVDESEVQP